MENHFRVAALAVVAAAALVGCGKSSSSSSSTDDVKAVTENFVKAFGQGDGKTACTLLTPSGQAAFVKKVGGPLGVKDCGAAVAHVLRGGAPLPRKLLRLGVRYADGRKATTLGQRRRRTQDHDDPPAGREQPRPVVSAP